MGRCEGERAPRDPATRLSFDLLNRGGLTCGFKGSLAPEEVEAPVRRAAVLLSQNNSRKTLDSYVRPLPTRYLSGMLPAPARIPLESLSILRRTDPRCRRQVPILRLRPSRTDGAASAPDENLLGLRGAD